MPVLAVDEDLRTDQVEALMRQAAAQPRDAPVLFMVHGFRYAPGAEGADPHRSLYSLAPSLSGPRVLSWPQHMGIRAEGRGLAVGFGWDGLGGLWRARRNAGRAGVALGRLAAAVLAQRPDLRIGFLAHSLGARTVLAAIARLPAGTASRAVLMAPSVSRAAAWRALGSPAGRTAAVLNVSGRENLLFDVLTELTGGAAPFTALGRGLGRAAPGWADLRIDDAGHAAGLAALGFRLAPPSRRVCHWSVFLRPGLFPLYRAFLVEPAPLSLAALRDALRDRRPAGATRRLPDGQPA